MKFKDLSPLTTGQSLPINDWTSDMLLSFCPTIIGGYNTRWQVIEPQLFSLAQQIMPNLSENPALSGWNGQLGHFKKNKRLRQAIKKTFLNYCVQNSDQCTSILKSLYKRIFENKTHQDLNQLSPLDKLNLIAGSNLEVKEEIQRIINNSSSKLLSLSHSIEWWEGSCHLTPYVIASFPYKPKELFVQGIVFYPEDFNALLHLLWERISHKRWSSFNSIFGRTSNQQDINPAILWLVLTNTMGLYFQQYGVIADIAKGPIILNHYIQSYLIKKLEPITKEKTIRLYEKANNQNPDPFRQINFLADSFYQFEIQLVMSYVETMIYQGVIELHQGELLDGKWLSTNNIDFIWVFNKNLIDIPNLIKFDPLSKFIHELYLQAI